MKINIRVRVESHDHKALDQAVVDLIKTAKTHGLEIIGPIPVTNKNIKFALLRSPDIYKNSFERYKLLIHVRIFFLIIVNSKQLQCLGSVVIPKNVFIKISIYNKMGQKQSK